MKKKYFDNWLFYQIIPLIETNPYEAKRKFEEYLKQYPKDYTAYPFYISTLIAIKELDTAQNLLNYITDIINNDTERDYFMDSDEALDYGIVDKILK